MCFADVHEEEVRKHFSECGQIETVRLIRDKLTRFGKGFGYVLFSVSIFRRMVNSLNYLQITTKTFLFS